MHINAHLVEETAATPAVNLHIDNMPEGGGTPADGSITTAMLKNACVTNMKVEADAIGEVNIKDAAVTKRKIANGVLPGNATKAAPGLVKQAAHVADCAATDVNGCKTSINQIIKALKDAGIMSAS